MTKDERLLIELYRETQKNKPEGTVNLLQVATALGFKEKLTREILKGLMQANLVKWSTSEEVALTERGIEVARSLLSP